MISVDEVWYWLANAKTDAIPKECVKLVKNYTLLVTIEIPNQFQS